MVLFNWSPLPSDQHNGVLTGYRLSCVSGSNTVLSFQYEPEEGSGIESGFTPATRYTCSVLATTAPGSGPSADITVVTCKYPYHSHTHTIVYVFG